MIKLENLPHPTYLPYPNHYTAAFFHSANEACSAVEDLQTRGFSDEEFSVFDGQTGVEVVDLDGVHHGMFERFMMRFMRFSDSAEWRFLQEADQELRSGSILICVPTPVESEQNEVIRVLRNYGGYDLRYFTPIYTEEVE
jgi:hypothetical protein